MLIKVHLKVTGPHLTGSQSILGHICSCKSGLRTVGSCSHSTAIMIFLSYGKYLDKLPQPGFRLNSFLVDAHLANEESDINTDSDLNSKQPPSSQLLTKSTVRFHKKENTFQL